MSSLSNINLLELKKTKRKMKMSPKLAKILEINFNTYLCNHEYVLICDDNIAIIMIYVKVCIYLIIYLSKFFVFLSPMAPLYMDFCYMRYFTKGTNTNNNDPEFCFLLTSSQIYKNQIRININHA